MKDINLQPCSQEQIECEVRQNRFQVSLLSLLQRHARLMNTIAGTRPRRVVLFCCGLALLEHRAPLP